MHRRRISISVSRVALVQMMRIFSLRIQRNFQQAQNTNQMRMWCEWWRMCHRNCVKSLTKSTAAAKANDTWPWQSFIQFLPAPIRQSRFPTAFSERRWMNYNKVIVCVCAMSPQRVIKYRLRHSMSSIPVDQTRINISRLQLRSNWSCDEIFSILSYSVWCLFDEMSARDWHGIFAAHPKTVYLHFICAPHLLTAYELFTIFKSQLLHRSVSWQKKYIKIYISESLPFVVLRTTHRVISFGQQHQCQCRSRDLPANTHCTAFILKQCDGVRTTERQQQDEEKQKKEKERECERLVHLKMNGIRYTIRIHIVNRTR